MFYPYLFAIFWADLWKKAMLREIFQKPRNGTFLCCNPPLKGHCNVQFVAASDAVTAAWHMVFSESQLQRWERTLATRSNNSYYSTFAVWRDDTDVGSASSITYHQAPFAVKEHAGVYDCATGEKITNRREIIQRMWNLGFASQRGRPLTVARNVWSGTRQDLVRAEEIYNEFRGKNTDPARKLCSVYTSAARHYAWPGTW